ncbi:MAG: 6-bladed beta-propeller, partial [Tannerella sp.]|nr:6-bladed beta-propeller [Tannerella sp.]
MKNLLVSIITFLFLTACSHREKRAEAVNGDCVVISVQDSDLGMKNEISLSSFVDKIDIIPLEFNESCMLGEIEQVAVYGDNIFVLEQRPGTVYRFDKQGNFLNRIGSRGQGPGELVELYDFAVNEEEQLVYLLDNYKQTVLSCSFDGEVKEIIKINQYADRLHYKDGLLYLFLDQPEKGELYSLVIRDTHGKVKERFFPSMQYLTGRKVQTFTPQEDGVLLSKPMNDTIYFIHGTEMRCAWFVDFGSFRLSQQEIEDLYMERIKAEQILVPRNRVTSINHIFRIGNLLYFNSIYKRLTFSFIYNTHTQELRTSAGWLNDDLEYMFSGNVFYGQTKDALIGVYNTNRIMEDINRYDRYEREGKITKEQKERLQAKMNTLRRGDDPEEMNPWILL